MSEDYGKATYVLGRHRKNPVLVHTSRTDRRKVYEFMIASKFKTPGLVSWKCVSCSKIKNGYRNLRVELKRKVPLILVDNDIIKEDPEKPLNAEHFCNGKEAVEAVLSRAKIEFVHRHGDDEPDNSRIRETIHSFAREAVTNTPIPLSMKQKRHVERILDAGCLPLLHGVKKRRKCKQRKTEESARIESEMGEVEEDLGQGSSSEQRAEEKKTVLAKETVAESPVKRTRRVSRQPALIVRPLPPYYCPPGPSQQPHSRVPQYDHYPHQPHHQDHQMGYYVEEDVAIGDQDHDLRHHEQAAHCFDDEELILADQQDVAYDIELR